MAVKILWYLTEPDGTIPWTDEGRWDTDFKHLQQLAGAIDKLGYYGALLAGPTLHVAARIREFNEHGTHAFILSGWPLIEEAHRFANLVFPLLDLDHGFEVPGLRIAEPA